MKQLLEGVRILDWTMFLNGSSAGYMLGDLGAEVIHIEKPDTGDTLRGARSLYGADMALPKGISLGFENANRSKKSLTLDLSKPKGREILYRLVSKSDVFLTNFHRSIARKLQVDYETLRAYNSKLVYCIASGYGGRGPDAEKRAFDPLAQARSGLMFAFGDRDETDAPYQGVGAVTDQLGSVMAGWGILAALLARELHGFGQEVESSLLGGAINLQAINVNTALLRGRGMARHSRRRARNPMTNVYRCADDKWLILSEAQSDRFWNHFCAAVGIEELANDPQFVNAKARSENNEELIRILDDLFASRPRDEWVRRIQEKGGGMAFDIVNTVDDLGQDPQVIANDYIVDFDHEVIGPIKVVGYPVQFSETPARIQRRAPEFGEHTEEVLLEVGGYTWDDIAQFREEGVI